MEQELQDLQDQVNFLEGIIEDILDAFVTHDEGLDSRLHSALSEVWTKYLNR